MASSLFKKPKRNFRKKNLDLDLESDGISIEEPEIPTPKLLKKDKKEKKPKTVVSFAEEDEEESAEIFKVKKSATSRRIAKQLRKERKDKEKDSNGGGGGGQADSDEEDLAPRDRDRRDRGGDRKSRRGDDAVRAEEKQREIEKLREELRTLNGDEAEAAEESDDDDSQKAFKAMLARGQIPDAKTIHYIRKQRQMARETDNFIPVEEKEEKSSKSSTDRLVRDDEHDKSDGSEGEERVDFSVNTAARERQRMRDNFLAAEHGSDSDSDKEREWEKQQIKKAASLQIPGLEVPTTLGPENGSSVSFFSGNGGEMGGGQHSGVEAKPFSSLSMHTSTTENITIESVRKRLAERVSSLQSVCNTHRIEMTRVVTDVADTRDSIDKCQSEAPKLEARFRFFQELRGYVKDLIDCLNEKVPQLNQLEQGVEALLKSRAHRLIQRRQQDVIDQDREFMINTSNVKMDAEAGGEQARQRRAAEREARRSRRRRARQERSIQGHQDGVSSDDEESSQSLALKHRAEMDSLLSTRDSMFHDVVESFSNMSSVRHQFEEWKSNHRDSYTDAYIGLCLPKLVNPFVRHQMLGWNPLETDCQDFEDQSWFNVLLFLGSKEGESLERGDDDLRLLPTLVEKVVLPKMTFLASSVWDPISTSQTARLVTLAVRLVKDYPSVHARSKTFRVFLETVVSRINKTLEDDVFMPRYPLNVLDNRSSGPAVFFHRQAWTCIKLLGNILSWHPLVSTPTLQRLALSGLLNRYIVVGLVCSHINREALHKVQAIISTFPRDWFVSLEGDSTLPQLENLCRYLVSAARTLHAATAREKDQDRLEGRELVKQMSKHLVTIHAMDHATALASEFSFKIGQV